jgi:hypothetical protein
MALGDDSEAASSDAETGSLEKSQEAQRPKEDEASSSEDDPLLRWNRELEAGTQKMAEEMSKSFRIEEPILP